MRHIYIVHTKSSASLYGIGTYIEQLLLCLKDNEIKISVVQLLSDQSEVTCEYQHSIRYIYIPRQRLNMFDNFQVEQDRYNQAASVILGSFIDAKEHNIFHLNFMSYGVLAAKLKQYYNAVILITIHYSRWCDLYVDDKKSFLECLTKASDELSLDERQLLDSFYQEKLLLNNFCDRIIIISHHYHDDLINLYKIHSNKILAINNALKDEYIDICTTQRDKLRNNFNLNPNDIVIIFAGRLEKIKGIHVLVEAFTHIVAKNNNVKLIIAGKGDFATLLSKTPQNCWSKIIYTGFINKSVLYELYQIADIGVVPSLFEPFGYVAVEMMMHKLPIVVNNTSGLAEIIDNHRNGLYVNLDQQHGALDLAEKINFYIENPQERILMGLNARKKYLKRYELSLFGQKMAQLYQTI